MSVMVNHPEASFSQWIPRRSGLLQRLEEEAARENIPIVGPVVGKLLYLLARLQGARRIVELGTATGYSAVYLASACRAAQGRVTTFETDSAMAARAVGNLEKAGLARYVDVRRCDALEGLESYEEPADMIFMDIEKEDYVRALPLCKQALRDNGLLVADNTGFADAQTFNRAVFEDSGWESVNLWTYLPGHSPEYDGLCLAVKRAA